MPIFTHSRGSYNIIQLQLLQINAQIYGLQQLHSKRLWTAEARELQHITASHRSREALISTITRLDCKTEATRIHWPTIASSRKLEHSRPGLSQVPTQKLEKP